MKTAITAHDAALEAAQLRLERAAEFAALHSTSKPWFQKTMRYGRQQRLVRVVWPGILEVFDPKTGEILARSEPGNLTELAPGFVPGARHST